MIVWSAPGTDKPTFEEAVTALKGGDVKPYRVGDWLGKSWTNHWVKARLTIPEGWRRMGEPVLCACQPLLVRGLSTDAVVEFDPNCEGLFFTLSGEPIHGGSW